MENEELKKKIDLLETKLRHLENDYSITRQEHEIATEKYLQMLLEIREKNVELQELRINLEEQVKERTKELKASEDKLKHINEELGIIFNSSPELIFFKDKDGNYVRVNTAFAEFTGMTIKEMEGKKDEILVCVDSSQNDIEKEVLESGKLKLNVVNQFTTPNGNKWLRLNLAPYKDRAGKIIGVIGFAIDITETILAEEEKKILQEQLFQSQKLESIGRLAGGIAHDFNNILGIIGGYAELLQIQIPEEDSASGKALSAIRESTERAAKLTKQLLGFARKGKYNPVPLNMNLLVKDTLKVSEKVLHKSINVNYELNEYVDGVVADKNQISQVINNLIINAKDSMPDDGVITITTGNVTVSNRNKKSYPSFEPGKYVRLAIADNGAGMSEETQKRVFEPFFSTKKETEGVGLGLATAYGIIENHEGHIRFESELNKGTVFEIFLPASVKVVEKEEVEEYDDFIDSITILAIDDEEYVRIMAKDMLRRLGHKAYTAHNGVEALEIYKERGQDIDLVLLDMIMPKMDGNKTFYELKKLNPEIKVIITSGYIQDEKANNLLRDGALEFIQKPFGIKNISNAISKAFHE